jgi:hypothetical protein
MEYLGTDGNRLSGFPPDPVRETAAFRHNN